MKAEEPGAGPPTEFFPREEARAFREYCKSRNIVNPAAPPASKDS